MFAMRVIVLEADGLPVWALGAYGNDWIATPHLDEFAAGGVVFDQHFVATPQQLERLSEVIYPDVPSLLPPWQFDVDPDGDDAIQPLMTPQPGLLPADDEETRHRLRLTFAAVVEEFDGWFGEWVESIDESEWNAATVILTAGRGQNLGEHRLVGEALPWLHEELVHVPLIVRRPRGEFAGRRVAHLTQTSDLAPTILSLLEREPLLNARGFDLLPLCRVHGPIREYVVMTSSDGTAEIALQSPHEKIIVPLRNPEGSSRGPMYFVKPDDRWDVNNLWQANIDRAEALERTLAAYLHAARPPGAFIPPALPQPEDDDGNGESGGREYDRPASEGGVRGHQGDAEGREDQ